VNRIGFSTIACPDYDVQRVIEIAKANDYSGIEIRFLRGTVDLVSLPEFSPAKIHETRRQFEDAGLNVVAIDTSVRMNSLDPIIRDQQRTLARVNIEIARGLGAPYLRVFGGPLPPEQDREKTLDAIAAGLSEIARMSADHGITAILETHDDFSTSESCLDLYARGASEALAILWDTLHTHRHGEGAEETWSKLGPRIRHVHIKDSHVANAEGFDFAMTGEGTVPIASFFNTLGRGNYPGFVHFEWEKGWHPEIAGPEMVLPHFARFVKGLKQAVSVEMGS
jgi:sugar phosphate isomerase/epimerase